MKIIIILFCSITLFCVYSCDDTTPKSSQTIQQDSIVQISPMDTKPLPEEKQIILDTLSDLFNSIDKIKLTEEGLEKTDIWWIKTYDSYNDNQALESALSDGNYCFIIYTYLSDSVRAKKQAQAILTYLSPSIINSNKYPNNFKTLTWTRTSEEQPDDYQKVFIGFSTQQDIKYDSTLLVE